MAKMIILLITVCLFFQMLLFEDMSGEQRFLWTFTLFCFPVIGCLLYLMLGSTFPAKTLKSRKTVPPELKSTERNNAGLYCGWEETIPAMLKDIADAEKTIDLGFYGFAADEQGKEWLLALCKAADRGVKVRVLLDAFGSLSVRKRFFKPLIKRGGEVHKVRPWLTHFRYHRKMLVVDGQIAWSGSMNIGKKYIDKHPFKTPWQDTQVRVEGEAAAEAQKLFLYDWRCNVSASDKPNKTNEDLSRESDKTNTEKTGTRAETKSGNADVSILYCGVSANRYEMHNAWIDIINGAKKTLALQTPYFIPDASVMESIKSAVRRGVRVTIMLPQISSGPQLQPLSEANADKIYKCGARVMLYPGYLHSKTLCCDDGITCIGSANLDTRSMMIDEENCAMVKDAAFSAHFMDRFKNDEEICKEFNPELLKKRRIKTRILSFFYWFM